MSVTFQCPKCGKRYVLENERDSSRPYSCISCQVALKVVKIEEPLEKDLPADLLSSFAEAPPEVKEAFEREHGMMAGKYVIVKKIGRGGMGTVYKAWDITLKRYVAVKIILPSFEDPLNREDDVKRFVREARLAAKLVHNNILQIYEIGKDKDNYYISMEYVDGGTLEDYYKNKCSARRTGKPSREDIRVFLGLMGQVITGMDYAHSHNVIHRDIKPENILLAIGQDGEIVPKIADFGLAKETDIEKKLTMTGAIMGTPSFMSPEQASARRVGPSGDVFSLGAVLYRVCAGADPFDGDNFMEVINKVINNDPVTPSQLNPVIPKDLDIIIMKALAKEPRMRYATAGDFTADIERFLNGDPIEARPVSTIYKISRKLYRNKLASAAIAGGIVILILSLAFFGISRYRTNQKAREYLSNADGFFAAQDWDKALESYSRYLALARDDKAAEAKKLGCEKKISEKKKALEESARIQALENQALKEVQEAWGYAVMVFPAFYRADSRMEDVWRQIDEAIKRLEASVKKHPTAMGYFYASMLYREKNNLKSAEYNLTKAIETDKDFVLAYQMRGIVYFEQFLEKLIMADREMTSAEKSELERVLDQKAFQDFEKIKTPMDIPKPFDIYKPLFEAIRTKAAPDDVIQALKKGYKTYNSEEFLLWIAYFYALKDDIETAEGYVNDVIKIKPKYAKAYYLRGSLRALKNDFDGAIGDFTKAIEITSNPAQFYCDRALVKYMAKDMDGAFADYSKAAEVDPGYARAYYGRGNIKVKKDDLKGAIDDYSAVVRIDPKDANGYYNRGRAKSDLRDLDGAMADFSSAVALVPGFANAYSSRAAVRFEKNDFKGAFEDCSAAIKADPKHANAYNMRGLARLKQGDYSGAVDDFTEAVQIDRSLGVAYLNRADANIADGDLKGAVEDYSAFLELNPGDAQIYYRRGALKGQMRDFKGAIEDYDKSIEIQPNAGLTFYNRGVAKQDSGDVTGAIEDYTTAAAFNPKWAEPYYNRGTVKYEAGDIDGAVEDFGKAINANAKFLPAYDNRAKLFYRMERYEESLADIQKMIDINPSLKKSLEPVIMDIKSKLEKK